MAKLKTIHKWPPGGFQFEQPQTNWKAAPMHGFKNTCNQVFKHRKENPAICQQYGLSADPKVIEAEVHHFNAERLNFDPAWCDTADMIPPESSKKVPSPHGLRAVAGVARRFVAGAKTLVDWLGSGARPVPNELAELRAKVCVECSENRKADLIHYFAQSVVGMIQNQLEIKNELKLETAQDENLHVCHACDCPLKLKVWTPLVHIKLTMSKETAERLPAHCWVLKE